MEKEAGYALIASTAVGSVEEFSAHCAKIRGSIRKAACHVDGEMLEALYSYIRHLKQHCMHGAWADEHDNVLLWYLLFLAQIRVANTEPWRVFPLMEQVEEILNIADLRRSKEGRGERPHSEVRWNRLRLLAAAYALAPDGDGRLPVDLLGQFSYIKNRVQERLGLPVHSDLDRENYRLSLALAELELIKCSLAYGLDLVDEQAGAFSQAYGFVSAEPGHFRDAVEPERFNRYYPNLELYKLRLLQDVRLQEVQELQLQQLEHCQASDASHRYFLEYSQRHELRYFKDRQGAS